MVPYIFLIFYNYRKMKLFMKIHTNLYFFQQLIIDLNFYSLLNLFKNCFQQDMFFHISNIISFFELHLWSKSKYWNIRKFIWKKEAINYNYIQLWKKLKEKISDNNFFLEKSVKKPCWPSSLNRKLWVHHILCLSNGHPILLHTSYFRVIQKSIYTLRQRVTVLRPWVLHFHDRNINTCSKNYQA